MMIRLLEPVIYSGLNNAVKYYIPQYVSISSYDDGDEKSLDRIQPSILVRWFGVFFDTCTKYDECDLDKLSNNERTEYEYLKELHNIYRTIVSDYKQYEYQKQYNQSLWLFKSYRRKNANEIAKKILMDIQLLQEGINLLNNGLFKHK